MQTSSEMVLPARSYRDAVVGVGVADLLPPSCEGAHRPDSMHEQVPGSAPLGRHGDMLVWRPQTDCSHWEICIRNTFINVDAPSLPPGQADLQRSSTAPVH